MKRIILICLIVLIAPAAVAQKRSIQERLTLLEQQASKQNSGSAADLVIQIQQLQTQLAELQGTIEEQNFQINQLKERQKVLYVDMDSRLTALEQHAISQTPNDNNELVVDSAISDEGSQTATLAAPQVRESVDAQLTTNTLNQPQLNANSNPTDPAIEQQYQAAFNQLKAGRFNESARLFEDFIQQHPNHELTDNSYYWLGESYYVTRNYPLALSAFQTLEKQFPLSSKLSDALLKIGYTYHELEDFQQAEMALNKVVNSFPNESVSRLAQNRLNLLRREGKIN